MHRYAYTYQTKMIDIDRVTINHAFFSNILFLEKSQWNSKPTLILFNLKFTVLK